MNVLRNCIAHQSFQDPRQIKISMSWTSEFSMQTNSAYLQRQQGRFELKRAHLMKMSTEIRKTSRAPSTINSSNNQYGTMCSGIREIYK
jgi:hypothetical protein